MTQDKRPVTLVTGASAGIGAARTPASGIVDIGGTRQLFVDDLLLAETSRVSKFFKPPQDSSYHLEVPQPK